MQAYIRVTTGKTNKSEGAKTKPAIAVIASFIDGYQGFSKLDCKAKSPSSNILSDLSKAIGEL